MRSRLDNKPIKLENSNTIDPAYRSLFPKTLFNSIREGIIVMDTSGTILDCNKEVFRHLYSEPKLLIGQNCLNLIHPQDKTQVGEFISDCRKNKGAITTFRLAANTGKLRLFEAHGSYVEHAEKAYIICWIEDITKKSFSYHKWIFHNNADRMALSPSAELAAIENVCQSLGFLLDSHRVFVTGITPTQNPQVILVDCEYISDVKFDSMIGQELYSDGIESAVKDAIHSTFSFSDATDSDMYGQTLRSYGIGAMLVHRVTQMEEQDVFLHVCRDNDNSHWEKREIKAVGAAAASIREILEWTHLSNLADTAEQQFKFLFQHVPYPLLLVENDATIYDFNKAAADLFAFLPDHQKKISIMELFPEGEFADTLEFLNRIHSKKTAICSGRMRSMKGKIFDYEISGVPFFQSMSLLQITDASEKRELDEQMFNRQKMDSIGIMAREIANDFNNLLGGMLGYISLLRTSEKFKVGDETEQVFNKLEKAAKRGARLTEKLLSFSSQQQDEKEIIELGELLQKTVKESLLKHDISIDHSVFVPEENSYVKGSRLTIIKIVTNLIQNAVEAMPTGGNLKVSLKETLPEKSLLSAYPNLKPGSYYELAISDTGIGMKQDVRQRIFEPFFTTKPEKQNGGMGMAFVYANVRKHNGFIRVSSFPQVGTTVRLFLPKTKPLNTFKDKGKLNTELKRQPGVLVVDDEELIRDMASCFLNRIGLDCICAKNGKEAVDFFSESPDKIDLVLMDIVMPSMDGREAAFKIKQIDPEAKILFTSGYSHDKAFLESIQHASIGFLHKPYQLDEFFETIAHALDLDKPVRFI